MTDWDRTTDDDNDVPTSGTTILIHGSHQAAKMMDGSISIMERGHDGFLHETVIEFVNLEMHLDFARTVLEALFDRMRQVQAETERATYAIELLRGLRVEPRVTASGTNAEPRVAS